MITGKRARSFWQMRFGRRRRQGGGEIVEFAILAPLLFVLLFGIIEFSLALYNLAILTNASREGARLGILWTNDLSDQDSVEDDMESRIIALVDNVIYFGSPPTIVPECEIGSESGKDATCEVEFDHKFLVLSPLISLINGSFSNTLPLKSKTTMRME